MKIVLTRSMSSGDIQYIKNGLDREIAGEYEIKVPSEFTEESIYKEAVEADVLLGPYVTKKIINNAKNLQLIQIPWTGMDTFDFTCVQDIDVPICNTHSNADAVAEMGVSLILDLLKKVSYHDRKMRIGNWNRDQEPLNLKSKMLSEQTVCILGFGNIGSRIGRMLSIFGAKVIAVGNHVRVTEDISEVYVKKEIMEGIKNADVVVCALPLTDATKNLINEKFFLSMKRGTFLVNISRAEIVDEDAVWDAIKSGKLAGFGSDVWWNAPKRGESEGYPSVRHEFWKLDNVVMSPHRAGFVEDSLPHLDGAIQNIIALARGESLLNVVDTKKGY